MHGFMRNALPQTEFLISQILAGASEQPYWTQRPYPSGVTQGSPGNLGSFAELQYMSPPTHAWAVEGTKSGASSAATRRKRRDVIAARQARPVPGEKAVP
jgi:hypothetical protein